MSLYFINNSTTMVLGILKSFTGGNTVAQWLECLASYQENLGSTPGSDWIFYRFHLFDKKYYNMYVFGFVLVIRCL